LSQRDCAQLRGISPGGRWVVVDESTPGGEKRRACASCRQADCFERRWAGGEPFTGDHSRAAGGAAARLAVLEDVHEVAHGQRRADHGRHAELRAHGGELLVGGRVGVEAIVPDDALVVRGHVGQEPLDELVAGQLDMLDRADFLGAAPGRASLDEDVDSVVFHDPAVPDASAG